MLNINFVPDDYVQNNESRRTNLMYLVLFVIVMVSLGGTFATIKMRQSALDAEEALVNDKLARAQEAILQFEQLQTRRKEMMKTALTTAELIESVPRSVLLASMTNDLPQGVSLLRLKLIQKEPKKSSSTVQISNYQKAQAGLGEQISANISREKSLETHINIEGVAPSDRQVASYIQSLSASAMLDSVALVESKEHKIEDTVFRRFKLSAMLSKEIHLSKEDMQKIKTAHQNAPKTF
jgi:Tfp pilus assembly protein PilN